MEFDWFFCWFFVGRECVQVHMKRLKREKQRQQQQQLKFDGKQQANVIRNKEKGELKRSRARKAAV